MAKKPRSITSPPVAPARATGGRGGKRSSGDGSQPVLHPGFDNTIMMDAIRSSLSDNKIASYMTQMLMGAAIDGKYFQPDINGYTLIFMLPPDLSGYGLNPTMGGKLFTLAKTFVLLALDFTPPQIQVTTSDIPARSGGIPYGTEVVSTGQMSITFLDNSDLYTYAYHKMWVNYIDEVTRGIVAPSSKYMVRGGSEFGSIDYATAAYVVRFKPTMGIAWGDVVYVGKAVGIFPLGLPDKELIGRRDTNELTALPISYACTFYCQSSVNATNDPYSWLYDEFISKCYNAYSGY